MFDSIEEFFMMIKLSVYNYFLISIIFFKYFYIKLLSTHSEKKENYFNSCLLERIYIPKSELCSHCIKMRIFSINKYRYTF